MACGPTVERESVGEVRGVIFVVGTEKGVKKLTFDRVHWCSARHFAKVPKLNLTATVAGCKVITILLKVQTRNALGVPG